MIILIVLLILMIGGFFFAQTSSDFDFVGGLVGFISGMVLLICLIGLSIEHGTSGATVAQHANLKSQLAEIRNDPNKSIERAALSGKIIEYNSELTRLKYYNDGAFDIFICDKVANLELIK